MEVGRNRPKCNNAKYCKEGGLAKSRQALCVWDCGYRYTVKQRSNNGQPGDEASKPSELYREGLGMRSMGRFLKFSKVSLLTWIKGLGKGAYCPQKGDSGCSMELDELHTSIGHKKNILGRGMRR